MKETIYLSKQLKQLSFPLFDMLKINLPNDYLITIEDTQFMLELNTIYDPILVNDIWIGVWIKRFFDRNPEYMKLHCDLYELFIDAGFLDSKLNVIWNEE